MICSDRLTGQAGVYQQYIPEISLEKSGIIKKENYQTAESTDKSLTLVFYWFHALCT